MKKLEMSFEIPEEYKMTEEQREELLKHKASCSICNDLHYLNKNGLVVRCECQLKHDIEQNMKKSGMNNLLNNKVSNFETKQKWQSDLKNLAIKYAKTYTDEWFVVLGQSGSGKTMICSALANKMLSDGLSVNYIQWDSFMREHKQKVIKEGDVSFLYKVMDVQVLYIDDLFKGKITDYDLEVCYEVINYRYNKRLITIVSSEHLFNSLNQIDSAIAGRMFERSNGYVFEIDKNDKNNYRVNN